MKYTTVSRFLFAFAISILLEACHNNEKVARVDVTTDTLIKAVIKDTTSLSDDPCAGAVPSFSVVDSSKYPGRKFHLADRIGYDEFSTAKGDSIFIAHNNCEYVMFDISILTKRFDHDTADIKYWALAAADILTEIGPTLNEIVEIDSATYHLRDHYNNGVIKRDVIRDEVVYNLVDGSFYSSVSYMNTERRNGKYKLSIHLRRGPL
ncbi:MAG: hypothetical protein JWO03_1558 [Bacteroidetes bacterium]|nr:hypothetical protein [Bacteroidota bacterium]